jgi:hypothetical protein
MPISKKDPFGQTWRATMVVGFFQRPYNFDEFTEIGPRRGVDSQMI